MEEMYLLSESEDVVYVNDEIEGESIIGEQ